MSDQLRWFKSSYSGSEGDNCVEVARGLTAVGIRDSKLSTESPRLTVPAGPWADFLAYAIDGAAY